MPRTPLVFGWFWGVFGRFFGVFPADFGSFVAASGKIPGKCWKTKNPESRNAIIGKV